MKYLTSLILILASSFSYSADGNEAEKQALLLLKVTGAQSGLETMIDVMLQQQIQQNPTLAPFEKIMREFYEKYLGFDNLKDQYVSIYTEAFTLKELKAMNEFYSTEVGKKAVKMMPKLMQKGAAIGSNAVQQHLPELQRSIAKEAERLKNIQ